MRHGKKNLVPLLGVIKKVCNFAAGTSAAVFILTNGKHTGRRRNSAIVSFSLSFLQL